MKTELIASTTNDLSVNELKQILKMNPKTLDDAVKITNTYNKIKPFLHESDKLLDNLQKSSEEYKHLSSKSDKVKELQIKVKHKFPFVKRGNWEVQELLVRELRHLVGEEKFFECLYNAKRVLLSDTLADVDLQPYY